MATKIRNPYSYGPQENWSIMHELRAEVFNFFKGPNYTINIEAYNYCHALLEVLDRILKRQKKC